MDKFIDVSNSKVRIMNPKSYEKKLKEEKEQERKEIHERKIIARKKKAVRAAIITGVAIAVIGGVVGTDYHNWKDNKYKQAGYREEDNAFGPVWVWSGLSEEDLSFGTYVDERCESLGIGKGR